jgi:hypothetical protein
MLVDRIGCSNDRKKYITMPASRILATILLILVGALASSVVQADELKEIARQVRQGQSSAALDRLDAYLKAHPAEPQAMFLRGVALSELNKRDEAIQAFTELTEKYPALPEPYNNLAVLYARQGQYDKARRALEAALKTHPSYATAHNNLADVYAHMASEAYGKALRPDNNGNRTSTNKLALIQDLSSTSKPIMLAAKSQTESRIPGKAETTVTAKAPAKVAEPAAPAPIKLAEPTKPAELAKPAEPVKPAEPAKPVVAEKPASSAKSPVAKTEPIKSAQVPTPTEQPVQKPAGDSEKSIREAVHAWALAWTAQNVEKYLASYAATFKTPNGESRKQWEDVRRDRLTRPGTIKVDISNLRVIMESGERARAEFKQTYRTGSTVMRTSKTLVFRNTGGNWLIEQERTGS